MAEKWKCQFVAEKILPSRATYVGGSINNVERRFQSVGRGVNVVPDLLESGQTTKLVER